MSGAATTAEFELVVAGGLLVSGRSVTRRDLGISAGRIAEVGDIETGRGRDVIDATSRLVLPGAVDEHVHPVYLDDPAATAVGAAHGGTTTLMHFAYPEPSEAPLDAVERMVEHARTGILDFAVHATFFDVDGGLDSVGAIVERGVRSFKVFLAYGADGRRTDDQQLLSLLSRVADVDGLVMVHAENGPAIDHLETEARAGRLGLESEAATWSATRPPALEAEAVNRAITLAEVAGCDLFIAHVTCARALDVVRRARSAGARVVAETCPHYLTLTAELVAELGPLAKVGPPLRTRPDIAALWQGLRDGSLSAIGSDHAPKKTPPDATGGVFEAGFGAPAVETLLPVVYDEAINHGRLGLTELVRVVSENPARIFGLYPRKGALEVGSDADLVLWNPDTPWRVAAERQHCNAGYSLFEGRECLGAPELVLQRGQVLVRDGELVANDEIRGEFLPSGTIDVLPADGDALA